MEIEAGPLQGLRFRALKGLEVQGSGFRGLGLRFRALEVQGLGV